MSTALFYIVYVSMHPIILCWTGFLIYFCKKKHELKIARITCLVNFFHIFCLFSTININFLLFSFIITKILDLIPPVGYVRNSSLSFGKLETLA